MKKRTTIFHVEPSREELQALEMLVSATYPEVAHLPEADALDFVSSQREVVRKSLPELTDMMDQLNANSGPPVIDLRLPGATLLDVPETPTRYRSIPDVPVYRADLYRLLIVSIVGWYGYGYTSQQSGAILNDVIFIEEMRSTMGVSASAENALDLHTEDASYSLGYDRDISPDFITLHFFRNPKEIPTRVSTVDWDEISDTTCSLLSDSWFTNLTNPGQGGRHNDHDAPVSIRFGPTGNWFRLNTADLGLERYSRERQTGLKELQDHLNGRATDVPSKPGDILMIDNRRAAHGRGRPTSLMAPRYDGSDRWQRRLVFVHDKAQLGTALSKPRVVDPALL